MKSINESMDSIPLPPTVFLVFFHICGLHLTGFFFSYFCLWTTQPSNKSSCCFVFFAPGFELTDSVTVTGSPVPTSPSQMVLCLTNCAAFFCSHRMGPQNFFTQWQPPTFVSFSPNFFVYQVGNNRTRAKAVLTFIQAHDDTLQNDIISNINIYLEKDTCFS